MNPLKVLVSNYVIDVGFLAWFAAQLLKTILAYIPSRRINWERMVGSGGMPSSHSALVCAIAVGVAKKAGYAAPEFAIAIALAAIVMYDAMGVRQAAGQHAREINEIKKQLGDDDSDNLPEKLGHRPTEVMSGAVLGIVIAWIVCSLVPSGA